MALHQTHTEVTTTDSMCWRPLYQPYSYPTAVFTALLVKLSPYLLNMILTESLY